MFSDLVDTILIPFCVVAIGLLAIAAMTKVKKWKNRKTIERGITDVVPQVRHGSDARSKPQDSRNHERQTFRPSGRQIQRRELDGVTNVLKKHSIRNPSRRRAANLSYVPKAADPPYANL